MQIRPYQPADEQAVINLWATVLLDAAPHNDPHTSLTHKLKIDDGLRLVALSDDTVVGTAMGGYDGHRGWIYSVAVQPQFRRGGIGTALCQQLEEDLRHRGCLKVNLQVRSDNWNVIAFYQSLGFAVEDRNSLGKRLYD